MVKIDFSQEEKAALKNKRYHHPHPKIQKRLKALYLKSQSIAHQD